MTIPVRFEFTTNAKRQGEAMISGTQTLMRGPQRAIWTMAGLLFTALMALGGAALALAICLNLGVEPDPWLIAAGAASGALYITHQQLMLSSLAKQAATKPLNTGAQIIELNDAVVTFETGAASWFTPWAMIDSIRQSKSCVLLATGGITFAVPNSEIGDKDDVAALIKAVTARVPDA